MLDVEDGDARHSAKPSSSSGTKKTTQIKKTLEGAAPSRKMGKGLWHQQSTGLRAASIYTLGSWSWRRQEYPFAQKKLICSDSWSFSSLTYLLVWTVSLSLRVGTKHQTKKHDVITGFMCTANYRGSVIYECAQQKKNDWVYKVREGECEKGIYSWVTRNAMHHIYEQTTIFFIKHRWLTQ